MKRAIAILALIFAFGNVYADKKEVTIDEKLIKEVKSEMEDSIFYFDTLEKQPDVLIYSIEGKLLHSFQKENIDPIAMRNVDFVMESQSQKIFIKVKELKPTI